MIPTKSSNPLDLNVRHLKTNIQKVDKIFHVADVHIRNFKRREEYIKVFLNLRNHILKNKTDNSVIYLAGDLVHSKLNMSPELVDLLSKFLKMMADLCPTLLILGNHDCLISNSSRMDVLSPIVDVLNHPNLFYLKENGYYKIGQLGINLMEIATDPEDFLSAAGLDTEIKIAFFRGMVDSSESDSGYKFSNAKIKVDIFAGHDLALLGDIHTRQILQEYGEEEIEVEEEEVEEYLLAGWEKN